MIPTTRGQFSRAKRHVARGHEAERERLRQKGRVVPVVGPAVGEHVAQKRLELSQRRDEMGRYAKLGVMSAITETAKKTRSRIWNTRRATVKPVAHKPLVVKTPVPQPPALEPSTRTPTQMAPVAKLGADMAIRKAVDDMGRTKRLWKGSPPTKMVPGPENQPVPESWRSRDF